MTLDEIVVQHHQLAEELKVLVGQLDAANRDYKTITTRRAELAKQQTRIQREMLTLKLDYQSATGRDLKKDVRLPTVAEIHQAHGRLVAAIVGEGGLPLDDPRVLNRLAEYRDAMNRHEQVKKKTA